MNIYREKACSFIHLNVARKVETVELVIHREFVEDGKNYFEIIWRPNRDGDNSFEPISKVGISKCTKHQFF